MTVEERLPNNKIFNQFIKDAANSTLAHFRHIVVCVFVSLLYSFKNFTYLIFNFILSKHESPQIFTPHYFDVSFINN